MRKAIAGLGGVIIATVFVASFVAYFVYNTDPNTKIMHDGFGRQLTQSPWLMRAVFGQERLWAGWKWFALDMTIFWGGIAIGMGLVGWGMTEAPRQET